MHVHVTKQGRIAKFWLIDGTLAYNKISRIMRSTRYPGTWRSIKAACAKSGESILANDAPALAQAKVTGTHVEVELSDGRRLATPLEWYPVLQFASSDERDTFEVWPWGLHWPLLDEDLSVEGMLAGRRSARPSQAIEN